MESGNTENGNTENGNTDNNMKYYLIVYSVDGDLSVRNAVTTEDPFDLIYEMNHKGYKPFSIINFWSIPKEKYETLCKVMVCL